MTSNPTPLPRCRWRRSGSLPETRLLWSNQGIIENQRRPYVAPSVNLTRRISTETLTQHIHEAHSLEHLHRLSLASTERQVISIPTNEGSSFHIYNQSIQQRRSELLFLQVAAQSTNSLQIQNTPSEVEF